MKECRILEVWSLDNGVYWAGLLAIAAENAFGEVDVVLSSSSGAVRSWLGLDDDGESWAGGFAELASDASLLASWVSSEGVFASEHGREGSLLPWVVNNMVWLESGPGGHEKWRPEVLSINKHFVHGLTDIDEINVVWKLISDGESHILLIVLILWVERVWIVILAIGVGKARGYTLIKELIELV